MTELNRRSFLKACSLAASVVHHTAMASAGLAQRLTDKVTWQPASLLSDSSTIEPPEITVSLAQGWTDRQLAWRPTLPSGPGTPVQRAKTVARRAETNVLRTTRDMTRPISGLMSCYLADSWVGAGLITALGATTQYIPGGRTKSGCSVPWTGGSTQSADSAVMIADGGVDFDLLTKQHESDKHHQVTQQTRLKLIYNILGHPKGMPSVDELVAVNPSVNNRYSIRDHLDKLIDLNIVEKVTLDEGRKRDLPHTFYRVADDGWEFLNEAGLVSEDDLPLLHEAYEQIDKPDKIVRYEAARRPNIETVGGGKGARPEPEGDRTIIDEFAETEDVEQAVKEWEEAVGDDDDDDVKALRREVEELKEVVGTLAKKM